MKKKKIFNVIASFLFMVIIIAPTVIWVTFSLDDTLDFDLGEKRNKATLSNALNIENLPSELEKYYNDRIPFRSWIIRTKTTIDSKIEEPYKDIEYSLLHFSSILKRLGGTNYAESVDGKVRYFMDDAVDIFLGHGLKKSEIDPYDPYIKYPLKYSENGNVIIGQSDWLFLNDANIPLYTGKKSIDYDGIKKYVERCEKLDKLCEKAGKKIVFLICPEKEEVYSEYMPYMEITNEKERSRYISDYVATASFIKYIYPKDTLISAKEKYITYKKYDSHWNDVGSFIATNELLYALGYDKSSIRDQNIKKVPIKDHELVEYGNLSSESYNDAFDYDVYYKPEVIPSIDMLPGDYGSVSLKSKADVENDETLTIIGDSFSHGMIQYLYKEFKGFYFISIKDITSGVLYQSALKESIKNSDILVLEVVERNDPEFMPFLSVKIQMILEELYGKNSQ